jgi:hypothetical protein
MKRVSMTLVVLAALAACGKKDKSAGGAAGAGKAAAADCDKLGARTAEQSMQNTPPGASELQRAKLQAVSDEAGRAIAIRCKDDGWTAAAVACGLSAKNPGVECDATLTPEQKQKMVTEVQAIFAKAMAADDSAPPPPTPVPTPPPAP